MIQTEKFEKVTVKSQAELRSWLEAHHHQDASVWLVTYKKEAGADYVSTGQVLDQLLCFGWIDGIRRKLHDRRTMQLISPRKVQHWTKTYKDRAQQLIESGQMQPAGLESIKQSKENGMWNFMDDVDQLVIPSDLMQALSMDTQAKSFFEKINPSSKRFVLRWLKLSKTTSTRNSRIKKIIDLSRHGKKLPGS